MCHCSARAVRAWRAGLPGFRHRKGIVRPPLIEEGFSSEIADGQKDGFRQGVRAGIMACARHGPKCGVLRKWAMRASEVERRQEVPENFPVGKKPEIPRKAARRTCVDFSGGWARRKLWRQRMLRWARGDGGSLEVVVAPALVRAVYRVKEGRCTALSWVYSRAK